MEISRPTISFCWFPPESFPAEEFIPSPDRTSNFRTTASEYELISGKFRIPFLLKGLL